MKKKILTLAIVHTEEEILLGMKKRGFGEGKWNGFGGKIEKEESIEDAARRELLEESGIVAKNIDKHGVITFEFPNNPEILEVHIFSVCKFEGEPVESEEMAPCWFSKNEIPYESMWPDDTHWLPLLLSGSRFSGHVLFDNDGGIQEHSISEN